MAGIVMGFGFEVDEEAEAVDVENWRRDSPGPTDRGFQTRGVGLLVDASIEGETERQTAAYPRETPKRQPHQYWRASPGPPRHRRRTN